MSIRRFLSRVVVFSACVLAFASDASAQAQSVVGIGPGLFFEDGTMDGEEQVSVQTTDESFDYTSDTVVNFSIWYLHATSDNLRIGAALTYYGGYTASIPAEDEDEEDTQFEFGTLMELVGRIEYLFPTYEGLDLILGAVAGIPILFPGGDFEAEIERLQDEQASVWSLPRIGYLVGPVVSMRYAYSDYLFFRLDLALKWEQILLFNTSESIQDVAFSKSWSISTLRTDFNLGIEVAL